MASSSSNPVSLEMAPVSMREEHQQIESDTIRSLGIPLISWSDLGRHIA